jgi:hypothetical protein
MGWKLSFLPGEVWQVCCGYVFRSGKPCSDVWLDCQKSAEVIVLFWTCTEEEGLNNRRFPEIERHEEVCRKQTTSKRRLPARSTSGTRR